MYLELASDKQVYEFFKEFNGTEESVKTDVEYLKEWLRKQPHLPNVEDDKWLMNFLLRCKNSLEKTKKKLDAYFTTKALMPEVFRNRDQHIKALEKTYSHGGCIPLPKLTPEGYRIEVFYLFKNTTTNIPSAEDTLRAIQMNAELGLKLDVIRSGILIYDLENANMTYLTFMLSILKKLTLLSTKTTPYRFYKIYLVNFTPTVEHLLSIVKSILQKSMTEKIHIWKGKATDLVKILPAECLPPLYGGTGRSLEEQRDILIAEMKKYEDWFADDEENKADLSKRSKDYEYDYNNVSMHGIEGSFRKICID